MGHNSKSIIMDTMRELVTKGKFEKVSVDNITKSCNLTRGSFYYHFQNKYDLLEKIFLSDVGPFTYQNDSEFFDCIHNILLGLAMHRAFYIEAFRIFDFRAYLYRYFEKNVGEWMKPKAGISFPAEQQVFITRLIAYGWTAFICKWGHEGFQENTEDLLQLFKNEPSYLIWEKDQS